MVDNITNAPENIDMDGFTALISQYGGVSKTNKFHVRINDNGVIGRLVEGIPILRDLQFLCDTAELPGRTLNTEKYRYYGPEVQFPTLTSYTEMNLTFICRNEMYEREFFDRWMQFINPIRTYNFRYKDDYSTKIDIFQYSEVADENDLLKPTYLISLEKAYPIIVTQMPLLWADDAYHRVNVTFAYDRWYRNNNEI
jgi:hypothetical protein